MDIPVNHVYQKARDIAEQDRRARNDILKVYNDSKMYINEKNYTTRVIEKLREMGYYRDIETLFREEK